MTLIIKAGMFREAGMPGKGEGDWGVEVVGSHVK